MIATILNVCDFYTPPGTKCCESESKIPNQRAALVRLCSEHQENTATLSHEPSVEPRLALKEQPTASSLLPPSSLPPPSSTVLGSERVVWIINRLTFKQQTGGKTHSHSSRPEENFPWGKISWRTQWCSAQHLTAEPSVTDSLPDWFTSCWNESQTFLHKFCSWNSGETSQDVVSRLIFHNKSWYFATPPHAVDWTDCEIVQIFCSFSTFLLESEHRTLNRKRGWNDVRLHFLLVMFLLTCVSGLSDTRALHFLFNIESLKKFCGKKPCWIVWVRCGSAEELHAFHSTSCETDDVDDAWPVNPYLRE